MTTSSRPATTAKNHAGLCWHELRSVAFRLPFQRAWVEIGATPANAMTPEQAFAAICLAAVASDGGWAAMRPSLRIELGSNALCGHGQAPWLGFLTICSSFGESKAVNPWSPKQFLFQSSAEDSPSRGHSFGAR